MGPYSLNSSGDDPFDKSKGDGGGWRIGFDVQIEGVGMLQDDDNDAYDDEPAADDDDEDDDGDSFYSKEDDDANNNDAENANALRAGYRPLHFDVGGRRDRERQVVTEENGVTSEPTPAHRRPISERHLELPPPPKDDQQAFAIPHRPVDIALNEEKIDEIKTTMSRMHIDSPPWASDFKDEALSDLVRKMRSS